MKGSGSHHNHNDKTAEEEHDEDKPVRQVNLERVHWPAADVVRMNLMEEATKVSKIGTICGSSAQDVHWLGYRAEKKSQPISLEWC